MKLRDLEASFVGEYTPQGFRFLPSIQGAQGLMFQCPKCLVAQASARLAGSNPPGVHMILTWFRNPQGAARIPDHATPGPGRSEIVSGTTLDELTLSPSIHLSGRISCGWHGWVKDGDAT